MASSTSCGCSDRHVIPHVISHADKAKQAMKSDLELQLMFERFPPNGKAADSELARLSTYGAQEAKRAKTILKKRTNEK